MSGTLGFYYYSYIIWNNWNISLFEIYVVASWGSALMYPIILVQISTLTKFLKRSLVQTSSPPKANTTTIKVKARPSHRTSSSSSRGSSMALRQVSRDSRECPEEDSSSDFKTKLGIKTTTRIFLAARLLPMIVLSLFRLLPMIVCRYLGYYRW